MDSDGTLSLTQNPAWFWVAIDHKAMELRETTDLKKVVRFVIEFGVTLGL